MSALFFGSISTVADTSELQRQAFNQAFEQHGLGWRWDRDDYLVMLETSGGQDRIAEYARSQGQDVDAQAVHQTKSELFQQTMATAKLAPRPGVVETLRAARSDGMKVGLVTTTSPDNVAALLRAVDLREEDFDVIVDATSVDTPKPDAAAYAYALERVGERAESSVAIEDNIDGVRAAQAAGLRCVAFPNENTASHDFATADQRVERLDLAELRQLLADG